MKLLYSIMSAGWNLSRNVNTGLNKWATFCLKQRTNAMENLVEIIPALCMCIYKETMTCIIWHIFWFCDTSNTSQIFLKCSQHCNRGKAATFLHIVRSHKQQWVNGNIGLSDIGWDRNLVAFLSAIVGSSKTTRGDGYYFSLTTAKWQCSILSVLVPD